MRRGLRILLGLFLGLPLLAVLAALVVLPRIDLADFAAARATAALGRQVTIGSLRLTPGLTTGIALRDARIANIEGGSRPVMLDLARLDAAIALPALLRGEVVLRDTAAEGFVLYLERTADRRPNWHFGRTRPARPGPPDRSGLPLLHDLRLTRSEVVVRTTGGSELHSTLAEVRLAAAAPDQPVSLQARGGYNGVALTIEATLGTTLQLRDAATPVPVTLRAQAPDITLSFEGTATDPLNVDGLEGRLRLATGSLRALLAVAGATQGPEVPLDVAGQARRRGDLWRLSALTGTLDGAALAAPLLELREGGGGRPDEVTARFEVARLDLDRLLGVPGETAEARGAGPPLVVLEAPDPRLHLEVGAGEVVHSEFGGTEAEVKIDVAPARIAFDLRLLTTFGAPVTVSGAMVPAPQGARIEAALRMREAEIEALQQRFGIRPLPLAGRAALDAVLAAEGGTIGAARQAAHLSAVLGMVGGSIAREVIEMASTDMRSLFRTPRGQTRLDCLLAAVDLRGPRGEAAPLRIRAGTGTIAGLMTFDLARRQLDLVIGSERETTDFFALDIPVRVSGSFANPDIVPAAWSRSARARMARGEMAPLPPDLMEVARASPCYRPGGVHR